MKKRDSKLQIGLTLLYAIVILGVLLITVLVLGFSLFLLAKIELIKLANTPLEIVRQIILYIGTMYVIIGFILSLIINKIPLKILNQVIKKIKELADGNFKARLHFGFPLCKHATISELSSSFNLMASELENTELLRTDFVNNFSHEFKTPIVSIIGFTKLLKKGNLTEEQKREYLDIIEEESLRLSAMATNMLNMTKIDNQSILTSVSKYNLAEQIRSSVLLLENKWTKKKIEFSLEFDEYEIEANEELLKQIWVNLIDNAIKYSPDFGFIRIKIVEKYNDYIISISNAGIEIPLEKQKKIFNKFYQADESRSSEGNGIGLAVVKRVIELHKGDVTVKSDNGITTFSVIVPKNQAK